MSDRVDPRDAYASKKGGVSDGRFSTKKKEKHGHKTHWILPNNQSKTNLFFLVFWVGGTLFSLDLGRDLRFYS